MPDHDDAVNRTTADGSASHDELVTQVWRELTSFVTDSRDAWRRAVVAATGLPFSRIRVLKRLQSGPLTITEIAHAATIDAPAASVAVSELEAAGYVVREIPSADRRRKQVRVTDAGREVLEKVWSVDDPAPDVLERASTAELEVLHAMFSRTSPREA
ncbi:MarR family winged helix-turn-helix transcriptional regulator [Gordonia aichiensis]|uniref:Putative MarR family transcriptional regulator n=1 Tax=Gordonia aichiensis NBRC 108223 TaxID=1220583 RepID=L7KFU2_9ACTN|nr:MarR family transcriptional regulator [Gordonia aichiensis]GAC47760.1 putative MarR family transcriptional regulator [Gordonia aichiensis NBRC 108223]